MPNAGTTTGRFDAAIESYRKGIEILGAVDDPPILAGLLADLGDLLGIGGDYEGALRHCESARALAHAHGWQLAEAGAEEGIARALIGLDRPGEAYEHLYAAVALNASFG